MDTVMCDVCGQPLAMCTCGKGDEPIDDEPTDDGKKEEEK